MKEHDVDYVKDSYLQGIYSMQSEIHNASLKQHVLLLKLQGETQQKIKQSLALLLKMLEERS